MDRAVPPPLRRARAAVAGLFVVNAAAYANLVPRLPGIKAELGLTNAALGAAVAAAPAGALVSGLAAGPLIQRWGSARVAVACGLGVSALLPAVAVTGSWAVLAATLLCFGACDSVMDVSMNAHGLRVERRYGRSIVSAMHGLWSLGAVAGAGAGSAVAGLGVGLRPHLAVAGLALGGLTLLARAHLLPGPDDADREDLVVGPDLAAPSPGVSPGSRERVARAGRGSGPRPAVVLLALSAVLLLGAAVEDSPASWGAVLLREELGTAAGAGGLVFVAFQAAMTGGRLVADRAVDRFGPVRVLRAGAGLVAAGAGVGLLVGTPVAVVAGFTLAGLGAAPLFPVVFHAAGNLPGLATGHGVATVAWASRVGFLVVPPLVGLVADAASVRAGLAVVPLAGLALVPLVAVVGRGRSPA